MKFYKLTNRKSLFFVFLCFCVLIVLSFYLVNAAGFIEDIKNFDVMGAANNLFTLAKDYSGFNEGKEASFLGLFFIGFFAGLWIWIVYKIVIFSRFFKDLFYGISSSSKFSWRKILSKSKSIAEEEQVRWLALVGSGFWKVLIIGIIYATFSYIILQIPIANRIFQVITLEILGFNWILRSFIIACYIGFGPALIEYYSKQIRELNYIKKNEEQRKGVLLNREAGKTN